jgi:DNA anti-recombination protein RmuC
MKDEILNNSLKHITTQATEIQVKVGTIKKLCNDIENEHLTKLQTHINTLNNKINSFSINKIVKKVSKIN